MGGWIDRKINRYIHGWREGGREGMIDKRKTSVVIQGSLG
jgi:hypothetical protein